MASSLDTAAELLKLACRNQMRGREERNYVKNFSESLGMRRETVDDKISFLEDVGLVKRVRRGQKKVILVNEDYIEAVDLDVGVEPYAGESYS